MLSNREKKKKQIIQTPPLWTFLRAGPGFFFFLTDKEIHVFLDDCTTGAMPMFVSLFQQILMEKSKNQTFLLLSYLNLKKKLSSNSNQSKNIKHDLDIWRIVL